MKKISYFVICLLLFGNIAVLGLGSETSDFQVETNITFLRPTIIEENGYCEIQVIGSNSQIFSGGKPMLPEYKETIELPFGVKIIDIEYEIGELKSEVLSKKIAPAPHAVPLTSIINYPIKPDFDDEIYESADFYPKDWIDYNVGVGLNDDMHHKTFLTIYTYPVRYSSNTNTINYVNEIKVSYSYLDPVKNPFQEISEYELVIISPPEFSEELKTLQDHKISKGVTTNIVTTTDIYSQYSGNDKPEQIKYFIKDAIETWGTKYVLLVGGLKSLLYAPPRDNVNCGVKGWYVPVRYSNLEEGEPGYCCDLYYSDIYKEGGEFDDWDSNGDGVFAEWKGIKKDKLDMYPDVAIGRLACRNTFEVKSIIDKIKKYEGGTNPSWFNKMLVVSGDGFLDMDDIDIQWDTNGLPNGAYTIYAQSENPFGKKGPVEEINIAIDKTQETKLTFNHDDHLRVNSYPADPVAEIVSVTDGDILGNTDFTYRPKENEAYCNQYTHWADVKYKDGILHIRGKTYDPQPYGNITDIHVWIEDNSGTEVFRDQRIGYKMYYEGEWTTGEKLLKGRGGGPYYMPPEFQFEYLWTSNGRWKDQMDVIEAFSKGSGFTFFSGHGSPAVFVNHKPGIPGNRRPADVEGLKVIDFPTPPYFPMERLSNNYKNPIVVVGGCHNAMFNVSFIPTLLDKRNAWNTHCYGTPTAECWAWWITRLSKRGAIACIGNTGYGYGVLGEDCTTGGVDNWITTELFVQYGTNGHDVLGDAHAMTLKSYIDNIGKSDKTDAKTVQQWVLLGDPSLKIGGYS